MTPRVASPLCRPQWPTQPAPYTYFPQRFNGVFSPCIAKTPVVLGLRPVRALPPADAAVGGTVYLRILTEAGLADESGAVARTILERFLN